MIIKLILAFGIVSLLALVGLVIVFRNLDDDDVRTIPITPPTAVTGKRPG
jgi:hypothetical protein